jgi:hypothetical protein
MLHKAFNLGRFLPLLNQRKRSKAQPNYSQFPDDESRINSRNMMYARVSDTEQRVK